ncbi:MarR family transcriptional regulator [Nocardia sp. 852002-20019_SCH5090214]|jgi:DNA-binding MarR family transcriptional regulator|uniref:MarR family transcriptional regulator n=2 Tax=Nocardiaceae TaxID=85025 RepID=A0A2S5ZUI7_9NOCA|nr:MarR family transcriptional regulator [Nocardia nova]OBA47269.1 MarR family transcriptional regulator [Nocardia sp. 852002-51101_SCH5132738]OBA56205.1 MarR family transcriptional regulator [Nocardia sp. 852002-20019_SCH5090214]OBB55339.1 MarR family transcriptional regulator [Nocardia sp. 852002-51244_SCH5132740]OBF72620.1 MarR family transcriptional regulator [Mycobacterium sp. 852002-51759_SCH5129042]
MQPREVTVTKTGADAAHDIDQLTDALLTASRLLVAMSARSIAAVDETITIPQFRTLVILSSRGPSNVATLAGLLNVQPSTATRMVDRLVTGGLLDRRTNPNSRREQIVALTERGRHVVDTATAHRRNEIAAVAAKMPVADRAGLVQALTAFTAAGGEPPPGEDIEGYQL